MTGGKSKALHIRKMAKLLLILFVHPRWIWTNSPFQYARRLEIMYLARNLQLFWQEGVVLIIALSAITLSILSNLLYPLKRIRNPEKVVEEIDFLHHKKHCSVFLFEDDDFPVETNKRS